MTAPALVVVGASYGGLAAIGRLLDHLPASFGCPVVLVQHRPSVPSRLDELLARHSGWRVADALDKAPITAATLHLAPPGYHLLIEPGHLSLSTEAPVGGSRPLHRRDLRVGRRRLRRRLRRHRVDRGQRRRRRRPGPHR